MAARTEAGVGGRLQGLLSEVWSSAHVMEPPSLHQGSDSTDRGMSPQVGMGDESGQVSTRRAEWEEKDVLGKIEPVLGGFKRPPRR